MKRKILYYSGVILCVIANFTPYVWIFLGVGFVLMAPYVPYVLRAVKCQLKVLARKKPTAFPKIKKSF